MRLISNLPYNFELIMDHFLLGHDTNFMNDHGGGEPYEVHVELVLQGKEH